MMLENAEGQVKTRQEALTILAGARGRWVLAAFLAAYCACLWLPGLGRKYFYSSMETSRAVVAREMMRTGEYFVPVLDGKPYLVKPPLFYWAVIACSAPGGKVTELTTRLPSALAGMALVLAVFLVLDGVFTRLQAFLAGAGTATNFLVFEKATSGQVNMMFSLWVVLSLLLLLRFRTEERGRTMYFMLATVSFGLAILTKGPPALVLVIPPLLVFLWRDKALGLLRNRKLLMALPLLLLILLPWPAIVVSRYGWARTWSVFYAETLPRTWQAGAANAGEWWFYFVKLPPAMLPLMLFIPLTFWRGYGAGEPQAARSALRYFRITGVMTVVVFSFFEARELRYVLPVAPMLCALGAHAAVPGAVPYPRRWMESYVRWAWRATGIVLIAAGFGGAAWLLAKGQIHGLPAAAILWDAAAAGLLILAYKLDRNSALRLACAMMIAMLSWKVVNEAVLVPRRNAVKSPREACLDARAIADSQGMRLFVTRGAQEAVRYYADAPAVAIERAAEAADETGALMILRQKELEALQKSDDISTEVIQQYEVDKRKILLVRLKRISG